MIQHIVLWKLKEFSTAEEKSAAQNEIKTTLEALKGVIKEIESIKVHFNDAKAPENNHDVILVSAFADMAALDAYQAHPKHVEAAGVVKKYAAARAAIDYEG